MIVRPALPRDVPWIVDAAAEYGAEQYPGDRIDETHIDAVVWKATRDDDSVAAVLEAAGDKFAGCYLATIAHNPLTGRPLVAEVILWVSPQYRGHGKRLLDYVENWALTKGCETSVLSRPEGAERAGKIFEAWGYRPSERWYRKKL